VRPAAIVLACLISLTAARAHADDVEPLPGCGDALRCEAAEVDFWWEEAAFADLVFDTGWVPPASNVQLRFGLTVLGRSQVGLGGWAQTAWPTPLTLAVPGRPATGWLSIGYGIEVTARLRFHVTILGTTYSWEGDLPFLADYPTDLLMADDAIFDPFVLPGATPGLVTVSDTTSRIRALTYDLAGIVPVPGTEGSVSLDVQGQLAASYRGDRIDLGHDAVEIAAITAEGGTTRLVAPGPQGFGAAIDYEVRPAGTLAYAGGLLLYPHVTLRLLGITIVDQDLAVIPITFGLGARAPAFEPAPVYVPLPDVTVSPAALTIAEAAPGTLTLGNAGEAVLEVWAVGWPAELAGAAPTLIIPAGEHVDLSLAPAAGTGAGPIVLALATTDPDTPTLAIPITITVDPADDAGDGDGDDDAGSPAGGCCQAGSGAPAGGLLVLGVLGLLARRRRTPRR
jgi:MYXO-CTERM domain-containing protein